MKQATNPDKLPWYLWLLAPVMLIGLLPVALVLFAFDGIFILYPERAPNHIDAIGTTHQRAMLAKRRKLYCRLIFPFRIARAIKVFQRRRYLRTVCAREGHRFQWFDNTPTMEIHQCRFCKKKQYGGFAKRAD